MRVLLILFSLIYFFLAPYFDKQAAININAFFVSFVFIIFFSLASRKFASSNQSISLPNVYLRTYVLPLFMTITVLYCYLIFDLGLLDRRQGSEYMALLFSQINVMDLILFRAYEIIFWPVSILIFFLTKNKTTLFYFSFMGTFLLGLFFSGALTSRTKIITAFLMFFIFSKLFSSNKFATSGIRDFYTLLPLVFFSFLVVFIFLFQRNDDFSNYSDYFLSDFFMRLNGLYLVNELLNYNQSFFGTGDMQIFKYYSTAIPFLETTSDLKELGLTNSKSYLLRDVLDSNMYDVNNSILTDPFYIGGVPLVALTGIVLGFLAKKIDLSIETGLIFNSRVFFVVTFCTLNNLIKIENDLIAILIAIIRDSIILLPIAFIFLTHKKQDLVGK
jgi:hypothetical protein